MYKLPKSLPADDRSAIRATIRALASVGYRASHIHDDDYGNWEALPDTESEAIDEIMQVDDASVVFTNTKDGDTFWVRFVMGNDPQEVVCDHSWRDDESLPGWGAFMALNALTDRWMDLEAGL